jgi:phosphate transport system substrate-binding protein
MLFLLKRATGLVGFLVLGLLFATSGSMAADGRLTITGSSTVAPLTLEIAKRFESQNPGVRIDVQSGGSSRGMSDARTGIADIGMVSRALRSDEGDLTSFTLAMDGLSVIIHASNPVQSLTRAQIIAIYTGQIVNWKDVGGSDMPISVVNKAEGRSTLELFLQYTGLKNSAIKASVVIGDNQQGIKTVAGTKGAIGYVSIGAAEYEQRQKTPIKLLPMDGIPATTDSVRQGVFPLSRPLNLVVKGEPSSLAKTFITFAQGKEVHDIVKEQFFVPLER